MRNSRNKKMIIVLALFIILLLLIAIYMGYFQMFKSEFYSTHSFNTRNSVDESMILRGTIRDKDGNALAYSKKDEKGNSYRINNYNYMYSPIIGYSSPNLGKTGIEAKYNNKLLNIPDNYDIISQIEDMYKKSDKGQDIFLTVDSDTQAFMYGLLKGYKGAITVVDPKTGNIIAMASRPTFNLNTFEDDWDSLINSEDGVLTNRATQGMYAPGSVFKVVSAITMLENDVEQSYVDSGKTTIDGYTISNYKNRDYGEITLREALMFSSNVYFADKSKELENQDFAKVLADFKIGQQYKFDLPRSIARIPFNNNIDELEKAVSAFGQGETLVTPLDMVNVVSAIANDGVLMKPRIVSKSLRNDKEVEYDLEELGRAVDPAINKQIISYLESTAKRNKLTLSNGQTLAGKTGTAEVADTTNLWYIGFGPTEEPKYAISIVLEDTGLENGHIAMKMFEEAMNYLISK